MNKSTNRHSFVSTGLHYIVKRFITHVKWQSTKCCLHLPVSPMLLRLILVTSPLSLHPHTPIHTVVFPLHGWVSTLWAEVHCHAEYPEMDAMLVAAMKSQSPIWVDAGTTVRWRWEPMLPWLSWWEREPSDTCHYFNIKAATCEGEDSRAHLHSSL